MGHRLSTQYKNTPARTVMASGTSNLQALLNPQRTVNNTHSRELRAFYQCGYCTVLSSTRKNKQKAKNKERERARENEREREQERERENKREREQERERERKQKRERERERRKRKKNYRQQDDDHHSLPTKYYQLTS